MYYMRHIFLLLILSIILVGCGRQVEVIQSHQFKLMADRMPNELIARNVLDSSRNYVPTLWGEFESDYGPLLFERLAADFIFEDEVNSAKATSFANIIRENPKDNIVIMRPNGFTVISNLKPKTKKNKSKVKAERRVEIDMVAVTDWDDNGEADWLVAGKLLRTRGAIPRIYYIVIPNPAQIGMLRGNIIGIYDDLGPVGRLYMRESAVKKSSAVEDVVPGLKPITTPPSDVKMHEPSIKERDLD